MHSLSFCPDPAFSAFSISQDRGSNRAKSEGADAFACHVTSLTSLRFAAITEDQVGACGGVQAFGLPFLQESLLFFFPAMHSPQSVLVAPEPCWSCRRRMRSKLPVSSVRAHVMPIAAGTSGGRLPLFLRQPLAVRNAAFQLFSPRLPCE